MATKKTVAKKAPAKSAAKVATKPASKVVAKATTKATPKAAAKPVAKVVAKATPKVANKPSPKTVTKATSKATAKPATKVEVKAAPKAVAKVAPKTVAKVAPKAVAKAAPKAAAKAAPKAAAKVAPKSAPKEKAKPAPKVAEVKKALPTKAEAPVSKSSPKPVAKSSASATSVSKPMPKSNGLKPLGKSGPSKTLGGSQTSASKADLFKTNTFGETVLRNDKGKVIANRPMSTLKRKSTEAEELKKNKSEEPRSLLDMTDVTPGPTFRYSDEDLQEFKELILRKLEVAKAELQYLQSVIMRKDDGGTDDTENKYQNIEDGSASMEREQFTQLAGRQLNFINHLEQALVRIENKTYGICRETGKLIDKARLRAVPHATLSIEAKNAKKN